MKTKSPAGMAKSSSLDMRLLFRRFCDRETKVLSTKLPFLTSAQIHAKVKKRWNSLSTEVKLRSSSVKRRSSFTTFSRGRVSGRKFFGGGGDVTATDLRPNLSFESKNEKRGPAGNRIISRVETETLASTGQNGIPNGIESEDPMNITRSPEKEEQKPKDDVAADGATPTGSTTQPRRRSKRLAAVTGSGRTGGADSGLDNVSTEDAKQGPKRQFTKVKLRKRQLPESIKLEYEFSDRVEFGESVDAALRGMSEIDQVEREETDDLIQGIQTWAASMQTKLGDDGGGSVNGSKKSKAGKSPMRKFPVRKSKGIITQHARKGNHPATRGRMVKENGRSRLMSTNALGKKADVEQMRGTRAMLDHELSSPLRRSTRLARLSQGSAMSPGIADGSYRVSQSSGDMETEESSESESDDAILITRDGQHVHEGSPDGQGSPSGAVTFPSSEDVRGAPKYGNDSSAREDSDSMDADPVLITRSDQSDCSVDNSPVTTGSPDKDINFLPEPDRVLFFPPSEPGTSSTGDGAAAEIEGDSSHLQMSAGRAICDSFSQFCSQQSSLIDSEDENEVDEDVEFPSDGNEPFSSPAREQSQSPSILKDCQNTVEMLQVGAFYGVGSRTRNSAGSNKTTVRLNGPSRQLSDHTEGAKIEEETAVPNADENAENDGEKTVEPENLLCDMFAERKPPPVRSEDTKSKRMIASRRVSLLESNNFSDLYGDEDIFM